MNHRQRKQRARERKGAAGESPRKRQGDQFEAQIPRRDPHSPAAISSSQRAQRSEVHDTTNDASSSPASDARTTKSRPERSRPTRRRAALDRDIADEISGGPGAGDSSRSGGAGAGIPGGGTDIRMGKRIPRGNPDEDRARLFPDSQGDRDESDFGGPARINTDDAGNLKD
jgi:hypothetical protein